MLEALSVFAALPRVGGEGGLRFGLKGGRNPFVREKAWQAYLNLCSIVGEDDVWGLESDDRDDVVDNGGFSKSRVVGRGAE